MKIMHEPSKDSPFIVLYKEAGIPSAPLVEGECCALNFAASLFPEILKVRGKKEIEHGLVHRIDTRTNGLILIAASQECYDFFIEAQKRGQFEKWYKAELDRIPEIRGLLSGFPPLPFDQPALTEVGKSFRLESFFRPFGKKGREVRPVTKDGGMAARKKSGGISYSTEITLISEDTALCHIKKGFRHQVRCHLAWLGLPVKNDMVYKPSCRNLTEGLEKSSEKSLEEMKFSACKISFPHPLTHELQVFQM